MIPDDAENGEMNNGVFAKMWRFALMYKFRHIKAKRFLLLANPLALVSTVSAGFLT